MAIKKAKQRGEREYGGLEWLSTNAGWRGFVKIGSVSHDAFVAPVYKDGRRAVDADGNELWRAQVTSIVTGPAPDIDVVTIGAGYASDEDAMCAVAVHLDLREPKGSRVDPLAGRGEGGAG